MSQNLGLLKANSARLRTSLAGKNHPPRSISNQQNHEEKPALKIYTKTGDKGETGLLGGVRVSKSHLGIEVCGCLDESNSLLGVVLSQQIPELVQPMLTQIQNDLFDLGSRIAACAAETSRPAELPPSRREQLESWIDDFQAELAELREFILPGGSPAGAMLHLARSVCRRTERRLVALIETGVQREFSAELIYLNRLGDLLFVMARFVNQANGSNETKWSVTR